MIDVSIIIVNFRTPDLTINCVKSILEFTHNITYEIIVVDNNSNDDSLYKFQKIAGNVTLIESESNIGFGRANNLGASVANGEYLFFLNSDTILHNNACLKFMDYFSNLDLGHDTGALGCIMLDSCGRRNFRNSYSQFPSIGSFFYYKLVDFLNLRKGKYSSVEKVLDNCGFIVVDFIVGADLFIRKDLFNIIGGFDDKYFLYWEEVDLQYRLKNLGYVSKIINGPIITHFEGSSSTKVGTIWKRNQEATSLLLFVHLNYSKIHYVFFKIAFYMVFFAQLARFKYSPREEFQFFKILNRI